MKYRTLNPIFSINTTTNSKRYFRISRKENILTVAQATNLVNNTQFNGQLKAKYNVEVDLKLRKLR